MFDSYSDDIASDINPQDMDAERARLDDEQFDLEQAIYDAEIADLGGGNE